VTLLQVVRLGPPTYEPILRRELNRVRTTHTLLSRAMNVAWLLLALDADGDPDNGLDVRGHQELRRDSVDFDVPLVEFSRQLARLAPDLNNNIPYSRPLVFLYRTAGIRVRAMIPVRRAWDANSDGSDEFFLTGEYDSNGAISRTDVDLDADGTIDVVTHYTWGKLGRRASYVMAPTPGSSASPLSSTLIYDYDPHGNLTRLIIRDVDASLPIFPPEQRISRTFDRHGRTLTEVSDGCDIDCTTVHSRERLTYTRDGDGNATLEVRERDVDFDGVIDSRNRTVSTFNATGQVLTSVVSSERSSGDVEGRWYQAYQYDANGRIARFTSSSDDDADGTIDYQSSYIYAYDAAGNLSHQEFEAEPAPGIFYRYEIDSAFDDDRRLLSEVQDADQDFDGVPDYRSARTYLYDTNGMSTRAEYTSEDLVTGDVDHRMVIDTRYGPDGAPLTEVTSEDYDGDGIFERTETTRLEYEPSEDAIAQIASTYLGD
jgi:hypothetical protein